MTFKDLSIKIINEILNPAVDLLVAVAVILFLYGVVRYIKAGDNEEEVKKGKQFIVYGLIGFFVMISMWGLVNVLSGTFGLKGNVPKPLPYTTK